METMSLYEVTFTVYNELNTASKRTLEDFHVEWKPTSYLE